MSTQTITFNASGSWTCPEGVLQIDKVQCWGRGGDGGGTGDPGNGAGGGGGGYSETDGIAVTPGTTYNFAITTSTTTFTGDSASVMAHAGQNGVTGSIVNDGPGGPGGPVGTGAITSAGGNGGGQHNTGSGGGGGGSGGATSSGGQGGNAAAGAVPGTGGAPGTGGGEPGGSGGTSSVPPVAGSTPGGGGGGAAAPLDIRFGAPGGSGQVTLTWQAPLPPPVPTPGPVPAGRGRWRLTLHKRQYGNALRTDTFIAELVEVRGRQLTQELNKPAILQFSLDGHSTEAMVIRELQTDVIAWRWDEQQGADVAMFRGIIAQSEDEVSEQRHTVTVTCHDYLAMLARRIFTWGWAPVQVDQDDIAAQIVHMALNITTTNQATNFADASYLPMKVQRVDPDGRNRVPLSGALRDRQFLGNALMSEMLDDLANVVGGFDYDVLPGEPVDLLRIFYQQQGFSRTDVLLEYGSTIASFTRSMNSTDYGNFVRGIGQSADDTNQFYSEQFNTDSINLDTGLWMTPENYADVTVRSTLDDSTLGELARESILIPSYTITLTPNTYHYGMFNMGDSVPFVIHSGRIDESNESVRIVGISYDIGDDGQENVGITVGSSPTTLYQLIRAGATDVNALTRR